MAIKPLDDRIVVKPHEAEEKTSSGIFLPDSAREKPTTATVIAVGPGKLNDSGERSPVEVEEGDTVIYGKYAGTEVEVDGDKHVILRESELLAKMEK
jgi:chaperonin GroES